MNLTKYLTEKEFHNPIIDGVIGGFGDGIGELLYDHMVWHSYRWPTKKWEDLNPTAKILNKLDGRACQLRDSYYVPFRKIEEEKENAMPLYEAHKKAEKTPEYKRLSCYWKSESFFKGITKLLLGPMIFLVGMKERNKRLLNKTKYPLSPSQ